MENIAKISFIISVAAFVAASANVASVSGTALNPASARGSIVTIETGKLTPMAKTSNRAVPAMLLPNALDKAAADESKRRAADIAARKAALESMQRGVIRLR